MRKAITFLTALLVMAQLVACGGSEVTPTDPTDTTDSETVTDQATSRQSSLPEKLDFKGTEIKILYWKGQGECTDTQNGEIVNDALYQRDRTVEDRLGVKLTNIEREYTWDGRAQYIDTIRQSVMANDGAFDLVSGQYYAMPALIPDGALLALNETKYVDFSNPWWANGLVDQTAINGKVYLASGEISIANIKDLSCFYYNKRLVKEYSLEDPYELVKSGDWTLDKLFRMTAEIYSDLDNDGKKSIGDLYGCYLYNDNAVYPLLTGAGIRMTTLDKDGYPELTFGTERAIDVMDKIANFVHNENGSFLPSVARTGNETDVKKAFSSGLGVFTAGLVSDAATQYNEMDDDFGVLPTPKYDSAQENYLTLVNENNTLFGITASTADPDAASAVMEALCEENHYTVSPAYFEVALKVKYSRDEESAQMFDLIREGVTFDFGRLYVGATGVTLGSSDMKNAIIKDESWASTYASKKDAAKAAIDSFIESVKKLG